MNAKTRKAAATETTENAQAETAQQKTVDNKKITPLKKITVKAVCGKIKVAEIPAIGDEKKLCRFTGIADGTDSGTSDYGPWTALKGSFAATNFLTGEMFVAKTCFVPAAMGDALFDAVNNAQKEDAGSTLKFVVDVFIVQSPRDEEKYEYIVRPVMENALGNEAMELLSYQG